jgi:uncharacterized integral membrane protein
VGVAAAAGVTGFPAAQRMNGVAWVTPFLFVEGLMRSVRLLVLLAVAVLAGLFASVNTQPVRMNYLLGSAEWPLAYLLLAVVACGVLLGWLAALPARWRSSRQLRRLRARQRELEAELTARSTDLQAPHS